MTLIADFYLETPVLAATLEAVPDMQIAVEQHTSQQSKPVAITFWAEGGDFGAFEDAIDDDPTVTNPEVLASIDSQRLYQVELTEQGDELITYHSWADVGGVFVSSERMDAGWHVRIRFPDRESLRQYAEFCEEKGLKFDLRQLYDAGGRDSASFGLTDRQAETLQLATEMGYFEVPRRAELEDIAERLGVSRQAVSERVRRATEALARATIFVEPETDESEENEE
ncbi:helix-turn-helix domain-containing protein [Halorussus halophilus]|uniref:helix-turn-helix domain-containing protein n=1 Tax=Halorussus halophilus TaxID=2650975 RepID=UPI0013017BF1|nr:helix-turn-helix domain-containing protein [Halorussus halophilus]